MLITFSGLDGSGKSTLIGRRDDWLGVTGSKVVVRTMYDHIGAYAWVRALRDAARRKIGLRPPESIPGDQLLAAEVQEARRTFLGRLIMRMIRSRSMRFSTLFVDLALFRVYRRVVERRGGVLITDRYFYDTLADLTESGRWRGVHLALRFIPDPDLAVFVDVPPEEAWRRKGEYPVEWARERRARYLRLVADVPKAAVIPNDDVERAVSELRAALDGMDSR